MRRGAAPPAGFDAVSAAIGAAGGTGLLIVVPALPLATEER